MKQKTIKEQSDTIFLDAWELYIAHCTQKRKEAKNIEYAEFWDGRRAEAIKQRDAIKDSINNQKQDLIF